MATITLNLTEYYAAAKPFAAADFVIIDDTGFSFGDMSAAEVAALSTNHVDAIDARDDVLQLSAAQYVALGSVALTPADIISLHDWSAVLNPGSIEQISGLVARGVDYIDVIDGKLTYNTTQYAALGNLPLAAGDALQVEGTSIGEQIVGRDSNDTLKGYAGNDALFGGLGDDRLFGGAGRDTLTGGAGKDSFVFNYRLNKKLNVDRVSDFSVKDDSLYLDNAVFKKLGKGSEAKPGALKKEFFVIGNKAQESDDYLLYSKARGVLYYDSDGSGPGGVVPVAFLPKNLKLSYHDFFVI